MGAFSSLTDGDFAVAVARLLPRGRAWPRRAGSTLMGYAAAIADCLYLFHRFAVLLLDVESDPAQAVQLLPDFEADYGLPDSCSPAVLTVEGRRAALLAKIASIGGQSAGYYIGVAAALGYDITITIWRPFLFGNPFWGPMPTASWRFAWRVNAPTITVQRFQFGVGQFGEPFWTIGNSELQCRLTKIAPAYGVLWFQFG